MNPVKEAIWRWLIEKLSLAQVETLSEYVKKERAARSRSERAAQGQNKG